MQHNSLIDFYKDVLTTMGLEYDEEGFIKIDPGNGKSVLFTVNGKPMVLPLKEHIDTLNEPDENGELKLTKILYNPLNEDVIKGDTASLKKSKDIVEAKISHAFAGIGELLLELGMKKELQTKTPLELNKFIGGLSVADNGRTKEIIDAKSIDTWSKLYIKSLESSTNPKLTKLFLKKTGTYKGVKYNRLAVLTFPLLDALEEADKETKVSGYRLRPKDIKVFKVLYKYVFKDMDENNTITIGSNDNESPGFIALFTLFLKVISRFNTLLKLLKFVDEKSYDELRFHIKIAQKELGELNKFSSELMQIPSDLDINRMKATANASNKNANQLLANAMTKDIKSTPVNTQAPVQQQVVQPQQQVQAQQAVQPPELSLEQKLLYGGNVPVVPTIQQQQPQQQMTPQQMVQPVYQPQPQVQPMGVNNQQQMMQQPVYQQQPMMQQPMIQQQPMMGQPMMGQQQYYPQQQQVRPAGINRFQ